ncbi:hypothetical protein AMATHDRAFT_60863 [Amanita thiersii Skay4041]|uniref:Pentatricopeptide repeat-containing protein n=1 Tax=Amanita thiersii Skay4041 TaxID=703135 RepID=A0A2A9NQI4_9AGAR|nr:hypothetical protein AMATHDRAFT_60863 [Amanita thiersii Skay4041]
MDSEKTSSEALQPFSLTEAQMSRASCRAIHQCLHHQSLADAYYIVNSIRFCSFRHKNSAEKMAGLRSSLDDFESVAVQFGRPFSPRLSSHALLHGLLRIGLTKKAYKLTQLMIKDGIKVRSRTLEALMLCLVPQTPQHFTPARPIKSVTGPSMFNPQVRLAHDEATRMALSLLLHAQRSSHRRTKSMFAALLALCIFNGEIILGSLLFGFMVREHQNHIPDPSAQPAATVEDEDNVLNLSTTTRISLVSEHQRPTNKMLITLLEAINQNLRGIKVGEEHPESVHAAFQALAILANRLDHRQLQAPDISSLICCLYNVPRVDSQVWVQSREQSPTRVDAYEYFHNVLRLLILDIPSGHASSSDQGILPPLRLSGYNALLYYALEHHQSLTMANKILKHMRKQRSIKPDIALFNTLIRSGTTMHHSKMVQQSLEILRRNPKNWILDMVRPNFQKPHFILLRGQVVPTIPRLTMGLKIAYLDDLGIDDVPELDTVTLCSYITYLTVTGEPLKAVRILGYLLPELRIQRSHLSLQERQALQHAYLHKAVLLGPYVFTALLAALCKLGKIGVAERVWLVARGAERASHDSQYVKEPWSLPIHAFTIMLKCYGEQIIREGQVIGWARPLRLHHHERPVQRTKRTIAARELATKLYEEVQTRFSSQEFDAPFCNAALRVFGQLLQMPCQPRFIPFRYWKRRAMSAQCRYVQYGILPRIRNEKFLEVCHDIIAAGFKIPIGYHHMLVGHIFPMPAYYENVSSGLTSEKFSATSRPQFIPILSIPTRKRRGLPVRRKSPPKPLRVRLHNQI